jgi:hypothetical protein
MADETKEAPKGKAAQRGWKLGNGKALLDVQTQHGRLRVTNKELENDKIVAMLQQYAPQVFAQGLVVAY